MDEKRQPESVEEKAPKPKTGEDSTKGVSDQRPASAKPKPESKPPRKIGPSVDIGPGPGSDVVATPPRRI